MPDLKTFETPAFRDDSVLTFETDELSALCPFDFGGPDHYELVIRYEPGVECIESKSLKELLESYRGKETTAERLAADLHRTIVTAADPARLYVRLEQARRGGIEETVEVGNRELRK